MRMQIMDVNSFSHVKKPQAFQTYINIEFFKHIQHNKIVLGFKIYDATVIGKWQVVPVIDNWQVAAFIDKLQVVAVFDNCK